MGVGVPGADEEAVEGLVEPDFGGVVEAEALGPDSYGAPSVAGVELMLVNPSFLGDGKGVKGKGGGVFFGGHTGVQLLP